MRVGGRFAVSGSADFKKDNQEKTGKKYKLHFLSCPSVCKLLITTTYVNFFGF